MHSSKPKNFEENTLLNLLGHYNRLFRSLTTEVHALKYNIAEKSRSRIEYQINIARSNELEIQLEKTTSGGLREATFAGQMQHTGLSPAFHPLTASPHENAVVTRRDDTDTNDEEDIAPSSTPAVIPSSKSLILDRQKTVDKIDPSEDALNQEEEPAEDNSWHDAPCAPIFYPVNLKAQAYDHYNKQNSVPRNDLNNAAGDATENVHPLWTETTAITNLQRQDLTDVCLWHASDFHNRQMLRNATRTETERESCPPEEATCECGLCGKLFNKGCCWTAHMAMQYPQCAKNSSLLSFHHTPFPDVSPTNFINETESTLRAQNRGSRTHGPESPPHASENSVRTPTDIIRDREAKETAEGDRRQREEEMKQSQVETQRNRLGRYGSQRLPIQDGIRKHALRSEDLSNKPSEPRFVSQSYDTYSAYGRILSSSYMPNIAE